MIKKNENWKDKVETNKENKKKNKERKLKR